MSEELKPMPGLPACPFCPADQSKPQLYFQFGYGWIECDTCRCRGPQKTSRNDAVLAWNRRAETGSSK